MAPKKTSTVKDSEIVLTAVKGDILNAYGEETGETLKISFPWLKFWESTFQFYIIHNSP